MSDRSGAGSHVDDSEFVVVRGVLVEDEPRRAAGAERPGQLEVRVRAEAVTETEVDVPIGDAPGRRSADETAAGKLPRARARTRVEPRRRPGEVLRSVEVDLRWQHLHLQVVEVAPRAVGAEPDEAVVKAI